MGTLSPVSAALFTRLGVKHLAQEAKQPSNILKEEITLQQFIYPPGESMIFLQKQAHVHSQHIKSGAHTPSLTTFIYSFLHRLQIPLPTKQAASKGDSSCPFFFPSSPALSAAIVLLLQSKAKQSLPAQRSPSLSLNHLTTYPVPFDHLAYVYLFSRDIETPREPMTRHQPGMLRQHSSRANVRSQPWAES
jgi:hypothetical protein